MPMYQQFNGGEVLDLKSAAKGGVLGGGGGNLLFSGDLAGEASDLKKMIEELDSIEVPSVFICPISLDPMLDPVTLPTGQTYERANILKWFSLGHFTCPTTMQELWDHSLTPNTTLHHLIHNWFSQKYSAMRKRSGDVEGRAMEVLGTLKKAKGQARVQALKELRQFVNTHDSAKKTVMENGGVSLISSLLGPLTMHSVGSESIGIIVNLDLNSESKKNLAQPSKISLMVDMLNEGSIDTKINCTKLISTLIEENNLGSGIASSLSLLVGLLRLVKDQRHPDGVLAGLGLLKSICSYEVARSSVVKIGAISQLVELLPNLNPKGLELALQILEIMSTLQEGRLALKNCPKTIPNLVKLLMKVSENCTKLAFSILWAVCKLDPKECAALALDSGLAAKLLLVIQSGCDPVLKQQSAELLKLCSLNYTATVFISKCKLTRAIR